MPLKCKLCGKCHRFDFDCTEPSAESTPQPSAVAHCQHGILLGQWCSQCQSWNPVPTPQPSGAQRKTWMLESIPGATDDKFKKAYLSAQPTALNAEPTSEQRETVCAIHKAHLCAICFPEPAPLSAERERETGASILTELFTKHYAGREAKSFRHALRRNLEPLIDAALTRLRAEPAGVPEQAERFLDAWLSFYATLPDGEYRMLGEMRHEAKAMMAALSTPARRTR